MELRSHRMKKEREEFRELQCTLRGLGLYESGMEMQEMRDLFHALQASTSNEAGTLEHDELLGMKENDFEFLPMSEVHNSTMLSPNSSAKSKKKLALTSFIERNASSPFSSPEVPSVQLTFDAQVHHSHDWSPPSTLSHTGMEEQSNLVKLKCMRVKRLIGTNRRTEGGEEDRIEVMYGKRQCNGEESSLNNISHETIDSAINMSQYVALSDQERSVNATNSSDYSQDYNDTLDKGDTEWLL